MNINSNNNNNNNIKETFDKKKIGKRNAASC